MVQIVFPSRGWNTTISPYLAALPPGFSLYTGVNFRTWRYIRDESIMSMISFCVTAGTEDCLALNIYAPAGDKKKRPVIFWIYGGGFFTGSAFLTTGTEFGRNNLPAVHSLYTGFKFRISGRIHVTPPLVYIYI